MTSFLETIERARGFLQRHGRLSLRALKREFDLDDDVLEELVDVQQVSTRDGKALAWTGPTGATAPAKPAAAQPLPAPVRLGGGVAHGNPSPSC